MADNSVPYIAAYGNITKALERIKKASTPQRFTQDFLASTLDLKGGSPKPLIPFLKRTGFLASDGSPTELYKRFRNDAQTGAAAAESLRVGYQPLYQIDEQVHDASDADLRGIIVQATGAEPESSTVKSILGSFKALRSFADPSASVVATDEERIGEDIVQGTETPAPGGRADGLPAGIRLGYTINLHLPATSDVAVFDAIFRSLKEHLLR